jgi:hypothetical protein
MTMAELVTAVGVSRQRVHQILDELGMGYKRRRGVFGKTVTLICAGCGNKFKRLPAHVKPGARPCCSRVCTGLAKTVATVMLTCTNCGRHFQRKPWIRRSKRVFCTWPCWQGYHKKEGKDGV